MSFNWNLKELSNGLYAMVEYIDWERQSLEDFHGYAHMFGCAPGANVFTFALEDALRHRGMTLEQFRAKLEQKKS